MSPVRFAPLISPGMTSRHGEPDAPDRDKDARTDLSAVKVVLGNRRIFLCSCADQKRMGSIWDLFEQ